MESNSIPLPAHELDMARAERTNKRLWILNIILIVLFVVSNACWIYYESQFIDEITTEIEQEAESGTNYIVGGDFVGETAN